MGQWYLAACYAAMGLRGLLEQEFYCIQLLKGSKTLGKDLHSLLVNQDGQPARQLLAAACLMRLCFVEERTGQSKLARSCCPQVQQTDTLTLVFKIMVAALEVGYALTGKSMCKVTHKGVLHLSSYRRRCSNKRHLE